LSALEMPERLRNLLDRVLSDRVPKLRHSQEKK
jgi:hypothetical protein